MNKQDLNRIRNEALRTIRFSNKVGNHRRCVRINVNNSLEHEITKLKICYDAIKEGKEIITEAIFENGTRADVIILDDHKIIEILHSEQEKDCIKKCSKYPDLFEIEMVKI